MDMKKSLKLKNDDVSNVGFLEENFCQEEANEGNTPHSNLQLLGTNHIEGDVESGINIDYNNVQLLGIDNSNDFITENERKNSRELYERWHLMSKDTGSNLIERSFDGMNNLWYAPMEDNEINEIKNEVPKIEWKDILTL